MLTRRNALLAGIAFVAACSVPQAARPLDALRPLFARPAQDEWPEEFAALRPDIQEMYRYAVAHHDAGFRCRLFASPIASYRGLYWT